MNKKPLILVTNDDGITAPGLRALVKIMSDIGEVIVATEDQEIVDDVKQNGGQVILTKNTHNTGTDRIYEALQKIDNSNIDLVMNLQGDEPLMNVEDIRNLHTQMIKNEAGFGTLASIITKKSTSSFKYLILRSANSFSLKYKNVSMIIYV